MSESSSDETPSEISDAAVKAAHCLLPEKSKKLYEQSYQHFMDWRMSKSAKSFSENVLLAYMSELANKFKASSILTIHSKLKTMLSIKHDVDISKYSKLNAFLKHTSDGYTGKQSKIFTAKEIDKFLNEAPDEIYLLTKVALIFGVVGACRRRELYNVQFKDLQVSDSVILVKINDIYTKKRRAFTLTGRYYELCKKFIQLRPNACSNPGLFLQYRAGTCTLQNLGINAFGNLGKTIAKFLELPDPELYTGNCFRRTSAALSGDLNGHNISLIQYSTRRSKTLEEDNVKESPEHNYTQKSVTTAEDYVCHTTVESSRLKSPNVDDFLDDSMSYEVQQPRIEIDDYKDDCMSHGGRESIPAGKNVNESTDRKIWVSNQIYSSVQNKSQEVVNINIPNNNNNLQPGSKIQLHFNNCNIENVNRKKEVSSENVPYSYINLQPGLGMQVHFNNCNIKNVNHFFKK